MKTPGALLLVDDDETLRQRLARAFRDRGYEVVDMPNAATAFAAAKSRDFWGAVVDMRMADGDGLALIRQLQTLANPPQIVVLTGYGSIANALEAVRLGAIDYLTKPAAADQILAALRGENVAQKNSTPQPTETPSLDRVEWEHIQRVMSDTGGKVSETARRLGMDRRTLQRKLGKYPPMQ